MQPQVDRRPVGRAHAEADIQEAGGVRAYHLGQIGHQLGIDAEGRHRGTADVEPTVLWRSSDGVHRRELVLKVVIGDRKSTRLNSSHSQISYAVFCLKKKKKRK